MCCYYYLIRFLEIESHNESMGQLMGQWVNGSWVSDTMGQMGHGSPMVTHGPPWSVQRVLHGYRLPD